MGGSITSSPAIGGDGTIYAGSSDGKLYAINPNGTLKWQFSAGGSSTYFSSSPAIGKDQTIYLGCGNSNFYAINPSGTGKWTNNLSGAIFSSPAIANDGSIYVGTLNSKLCGLNANGTVKTGWPFTAGGAIYSSPAIASNGTVYVGGMNGYLYALNPSGSLSWATSLGGALFSSPALGRDGTIYIGSDNGRVYGVNPNGTVKWTSVDTVGMVRSSPLVPSTLTMFAGNQNGKLYALNQADGSTLRVLTVGNGIQSSPLSGFDATTFVGSSDGGFYAFTFGGSNIWVYTNLGAIVSSPVLGEDGMLYFGTVNSNLYAMHVPTVLSRHAWPAFRGNVRRTGNAASLLLRPEASTVTNVIMQISGLYGLTNVIQSSTNLSAWASIGTNSITGTDGRTFFTNACSNCFFRAQSLDGTIASFNALGHLNVYAPTGYSMIANQLNSPAGNRIGSLLPHPPAGITVYKWNEATQQYMANGFEFGSWSDPNMTLNPGEGVLLWNPTGAPSTLTFVGELAQGYLANPFPSGLSIRSSIVPQSGGAQSVLGFAPVNGDKIHRYDNATSSYVVYTNLSGVWTPSEPQPRVGESFWIETSSARTWSRTFSIWP
jgi:outer membrane protein assembly factor BamB